MSSPYNSSRGNQRSATAPQTADITSIWNDLLSGITDIYGYKKKMCTNKYMTLYTYV